MSKTIAKITLSIFILLFSFSLAFSNTEKKNDAEKPIKKEEKKAEVKIDDIKISLYGFIRLIAWYNDSEVANFDAPAFVNKNDATEAKKNIGGAGMTARESRFGLKIKGPDAFNMKTSGIIEVDFWGGFASSLRAANQPIMRLRRAVAILENDNLTFKAGNEWMLASPLNPPCFSTLILSGAGNLWARSPQVALIFKAPLGEGSKFTFGLSAARDEAGDAGNEGPRNSKYFDSPGNGEKSEGFMYQSRMAIYFEKMLEFGISGSYAQEIVDLPMDSSDSPQMKRFRLNSYFASTELKFSFGPITLLGEGFYGANLDNFLGSIVVNDIRVTNANQWSVKAEEIKSYGGWGAISFDLTKLEGSIPLNFNFGAGLETCDEDNIDIGSMEQNAMAFGNFWFILNKYFKVGIEQSYNRTEYYKLKTTSSSYYRNVAENHRTQFSTMFKF